MKLPFFSEMDDAKNILITGAGGGFDVFCGLPLKPDAVVLVDGDDH